MSLKTRANEIINDGTFEPTPNLFADIVDVIEAGVLLPSGTLSTSNVTTDSCDVDFEKYIGPNSANYVYYLYTSSDEDDFDTVESTEQQFLEDSGVDVSKLTISSLTDSGTYFVVLFSDPISGYKRLYEVGFELALEGSLEPTEQPSIISDQIVEDSEGVTVPYTEINLNEEVGGFGYTIDITNTDTSEVVQLDITDNYFLFADLPWTHVEGTIYEFRVYGYNNDGNGPFSAPIGWETNIYGTTTTTTTFTTEAQP